MCACFPCLTNAPIELVAVAFEPVMEGRGGLRSCVAQKRCPPSRPAGSAMTLCKFSTAVVQTLTMLALQAVAFIVENYSVITSISTTTTLTLAFIEAIMCSLAFSYTTATFSLAIRRLGCFHYPCRDEYIYNVTFLIVFKTARMF